MRKLQSQGVHHITIVGADRRTSIDFWEGLLGMPFVFEQPNLDNEAESHLYFDPGDGRLITVFTNEERAADPDRTPTDPGLRAPPRVLAVAGDVPPGGGAPRRARDPPQRRQGPWVHGLDLLHRSAGPADRVGVLPLRAAGRPARTPTCCSRRTGSASSEATTTSRPSTSPTPSRSWSAAREGRYRTTARRRTRTTGRCGPERLAAPCTTTATSASASPRATTSPRRRCSSRPPSTRWSTCWPRSPATGACGRPSPT